MNLTKIAVRRPLTILMIILMLVVMGYRAYTMLPVERLPDTDIPIVSVSVAYSGASSEDVNTEIITPLENAVAGISGVTEMDSTASEGSGRVSLQFDVGVNVDDAAIDVERDVAAAVRNLPTGSQEPVVTKADPNAFPIMTMVLSGPQGQDALAQVANNFVMQQLESVDGVAAVEVNGGRTEQVNVNLDPQKMKAYGVTLNQVEQAVGAQNTSLPGGTQDLGIKTMTVRAIGQFSNVDDLRNLVIVNGAASGVTTLTGQNPGGLVYLRDIATVADSYSTLKQILRFNGVDTVSLGIIKTSDANELAVADGVKAKMAEIAPDLPPGAKLQVISDDSTYTRASVDSVEEDLILAILITGIIMLVFLHTIRSTFIVVLAIPTSIISTFLVMWAVGFTLNLMTLMALTLAIGILVDDSIVVLENTERHLKMKKSPAQAAIDGRAEIGLAAIAITLVDVVVYLPVAFTSGIVGQYFRSYGLTIVSVTLFSLAVSFTLTPMLASQWLKAEGGPEKPPTGISKAFHTLGAPVAWLWSGFTRGWEAAFDAIAGGYSHLIRWVLKNGFTQALVLLIAGVALAAGIYLVVGNVVGTEFMPQEDDGQMTVSLTMPADANLAAANAAATQAEQIIRTNVPEVSEILTNVGGGGGYQGGGGNNVSISVYLVDKNDRKRGIAQIANALRPRLAVIPDAKPSVSLNSSISTGAAAGAAGVQVQILGPDITELTTLANQAQAVISRVPGAVDVLNTGAATTPETQLVMDRGRLADLGLTTNDVANGIYTSLSGTQEGNYNEPDQTQVPIMVQLDPSVANDLNQLLELPLGYQDGNPVTLGQAVTVQSGVSPLRITRVNRQTVLNVTANAQGRASGDLANDIEAALQSQMVFPPGYTFAFTGGTSQQRSAFSDLYSALLLSIVLIYMLLVALYQSWLDPLAILFVLPVTIVGAFGGLLISGRTLNVISLLGLILLTGVVTKNAILIVDFTNKLRKENAYGRKEALAEAGRLRLRPIIMTTSVLILALIPVLFHSGAGSELRTPMAVVVIGGSITSTLLSLVLVPVMYNLLNALSEGLARVTHRSGADEGAVGGLAPGSASGSIGPTELPSVAGGGGGGGE